MITEIKVLSILIGMYTIAYWYGMMVPDAGVILYSIFGILVYTVRIIFLILSSRRCKVQTPEITIDEQAKRIGYRSIDDKPAEGMAVATIYYWENQNSHPTVIYGDAIYRDGAYRNRDGGCLDTPSWWRPLNSFYSSESWTIAGHGRAFSVMSPVQFNKGLESFKAVFGNKVLINGVEYEPAGIEFWCVSRPIRAGEYFGLLVKE